MEAKGLRAGGRGGRSGGVAGEVWLREHKPNRDPLSRERITAAAVELLDANGSAALTMRRLAERLDVAPPTLYWHVKTKDDVLDLALDAIFAEVAIPERTADWAVDAKTLVIRWHATMVRHPWAPGLLGRPMLGPNVLARTEFLQSALERAGLAKQVLSMATHGLANLTIGSALTESAWHTGPRISQESASEHVRDKAATYPTLAANNHLAVMDRAALFEEAVDCFLAGLRTRQHR
ncbi:TetR/AcrR family transcriptional regulator [Actinophytocola sp.]|uniref:TetR/AcrR family transcriptional regulator n=1 Tax=Actinophytocola sp. TaxID=1872138 RepID=UPI002ED538D7